VISLSANENARITLRKFIKLVSVASALAKLISAYTTKYRIFGESSENHKTIFIKPLKGNHSVIITSSNDTARNIIRNAKSSADESQM
jgi:Ni,Fe-hydrogenase I small subunit